VTRRPAYRVVPAMAGTVVITYLELAEPDPVRPPSRPAPEGFATRVVHDPGVNREMYRRVGEDYQWVDRLPWSDERWASYAERVETHLVELDGRAAGYFELELDSGESAKVALFGLLQEFHGIGLGGHALTAALNRARELRPRVWLTTCTLDGPYALPNYQARGMRPFRTATLPAPV
jgi:GNAT superfamily N-acetyltransferase